MAKSLKKSGHWRRLYKGVATSNTYKTARVLLVATPAKSAEVLLLATLEKRDEK